MSDRAVLVPADPCWRRQADELLARLLARAGGAVRHGDHIGSTAVGGLAAKPVLDLQLAVPDLAAVEVTLAGPLESLGFEPRPVTRDHVPAGWSSPPTEWSKRLWVRRGGPEPDVNLHVRRCGAANERLALLFRDWFRAHPEAVPAYAAFKTVLAASVADRIVYSEVKDPVVDLVIGVAEPWAVRTGWAPHPPDPLDRPDPERPPRGAGPEGAGPEGVDLSGATLTGVRLVGARLREVDLSGARLREVDLSGARLREVDLPFDELPDTPGVPRDRAARPSLEEVLDLRADRMATVRRVVGELTDDRLAGSTDPVTAPGWPAPESYAVRDALRVVLDEEWWHRQYAERDLDVLTGRGPARPARDDAGA